MATPQHVMKAVRERRAEVRKLSESKTNEEIATSLGISQAIVRNDLWRMGLSCTRSTEQPLTITENFKQVLLGSILGDGHIKASWKEEHACRLSISHSPKQEEYLRFKRTLIEEVIASSVTFNTLRSPRYKEGFVEEYRLTTLGNVYFTELRKVIYKNGSGKCIPPDVFELNALGLAIWYMDDGFKTGNSYRFSTDSFSIDEINVLQEVLRINFQISSNIHKGNRIYIPAKTRDRFTSIVKGALPENMLSYKLHDSPE